MKRIFNILYSCHKWFGIPLALMFIAWYVSGAVMLYHPFPHLTPATTPVAEADASQLIELWQEVPDTFSDCRMSFSGRHLLIKADRKLIGGYTPTLDDLQIIESSFGTEIEKVDTLSDIDKWIPFNRLMKHLPIYRITGIDKSYTYVSSQTGEVLQHNTLSGRRWAWIGALPHYVYITPLRRDSELWHNTVIWMSGLCTVSVIFGLIIAVRFLLRTRRLRIFPRKSWRWHYSWGLFFGLSMLAFIFSGMMSLAKIPDWIMKSRPLPHPSAMIAKSDVDLSLLPETFGVVTISANPLPAVKVTSGEDKYLLPVNYRTPLDFSPGNMGKVIAWQTGESVMSVKSINNGVFYGQHDCPGYEAETENYTVYWNVEGFYRVMDRKAKAQAICYRVLHTMNIPGINRVKWLHDLFLWILLLGGMVIVATGTVLSVKSLCCRKKV
ncbi:MAG: PepSY domain-containing protein [Muribaculaceae bacterium]|nr:PepSY domain-containing protein [Muribaculaceae bacterium]